MPMYEYACKECKHTTEALRPMSDADKPTACERCGSNKTARVQSVPVALSSDNRNQPMPPCGTCGGAPGSCQLN